MMSLLLYHILRPLSGLVCGRVWALIPLSCLAYCFSASSDAAARIPLPRPKPPEIATTAPPPTPTPEPEKAAIEPAPPAEPSACQLRLMEDLAAFTPLPDISGPNGCGGSDIVSLEGAFLRDKTRIAFKPAATLRCSMAEALVNWVRDDVAAAAASLGSPLKEIDNFDSYDCRGRNRVRGAKISEHGYANALDIRGVRLANGKLAEFTDRTLPREFREAMKKSLCERFRTVLGPGSDGYHETHVHVDLAQRRNNHSMCQWDVLDPAPEVPLPRPRPAEAPARTASTEE